MGNTRKSRRVVTIKMAADLERELAELAARLGTTRSAVVREAVRVYAGSISGTRSALDSAGDLVGSLAGPGDLSTNKRHMKGFGR